MEKQPTLFPLDNKKMKKPFLKNMDVDKFFKIGILILGIIFLFLYYLNSQNNRYYFKYLKWQGPVVVDTHTGIIYVWDREAKEWFSVNPIKRSKKSSKKWWLKYK